MADNPKRRRVRSTPSFAGLLPTSQFASRVMRSNTASGTTPEALLSRELRRHGVRFQTNVETVVGKPDIAFRSRHLVVFCDGDFWHGRDWPVLRRKLERRANTAYWVAKIKSNIDRDKRITRVLRQEGWTVLRFWESEIARDVAGIAARITSELRPLP